MADSTAAPAHPGRELRRVLGHVRGPSAGPTFVGVGGLHGNEPAGVEALGRVAERLHSMRGRVRGEFVALAGNLTALRRGRRYVQRDLNRIWTPERVSSLRSSAPGGEVVEDREQRELLAELDSIFARADGQVVVLDLHTTSGAGSPFAVVEDRLRNRRLAMQLPVPLVLGLEEHLQGTLLDYINNLGHTNLGFEAGAHSDRVSIDHAEAAIWIALSAAGVLEADPGEIHGWKDLLKRRTRSLPRVVDVQYHHAIRPGDRFQMLPGFTNLQRIQRGQVLARDRGGAVRSARRGRILMPLYQDLGDDGFFLVRRVSPIWLRISATLRRLRVDALAGWLPGVQPDPSIAGRLWVDPERAPRSTIDLLHLLGFQRHRPEGGRILFTRRED